jgi:hypothetical protein
MTSWVEEKTRFQHSLYESADFWLLARSRAGYIESRDLVLADELYKRDVRRNPTLMKMKPRLVVLNREIDGFP